MFTVAPALAVSAAASEYTVPSGAMLPTFARAWIVGRVAG